MKVYFVGEVCFSRDRSYFVLATMGTAGSKGPQGEGDGSREYDGHGVSPGAGRDGFMTVSKAKSPDAERHESAEGAILRKVRGLELSKPLLSWKRQELEALGEHLQARRRRAGRRPSDDDDNDEEATSSDRCPNLAETLAESNGGTRVQWALEAAFAALAKWYARQATLVTRQQLALHEEIDEVGYMAKLAVQGVTGNRDALRQAVKDVQGLEAVAREISQLRAAVTSAAEAQRRLEAAVDEAERSGALGTPG